jgi:ral guanine nucleotide dissociation stimulator-like 1
MDELLFAEQLTYIDKELFQKVIPHHCLGAIWSSRKKQNNGSNLCNFETISAFIEQFNVITFIVQGTVLENYNQTPYQRAKIIEKWIRIALYCRNYKNFSSLNAIVQGLDTQCVSRLEKTWNEVSLLVI